MGELLDAAVSPANIVITALFAFVIIYWLTVIIGVLDVDALDLDLDLDLDMDVDTDAEVDVDVDADADAHGVSVTWLNSALAFFNLHQIPIMIFMTFLIVPMWAIMLIVNDMLGNSSFLIGLIILIPVFIVSLFIAKILTMPFVRIFEKMYKSMKVESMIGRICVVTISARSDKVGQATVKTDGAPFLLNILTSNGVEMNTGDTGLVIEQIKERNAYLIEPFKQ